MTFKDLHRQNKPLIIGNVWDVQSAIWAEELGFQAIGTSSAAMAGLLGYQDGETMPFSELEFMVKRIRKGSKLPLSVDLEAGYSRKPAEIVEYIQRLVDIGIVGINIEDSVMAPERQLLDSEVFADRLAQVRQLLKERGIPVFINVRTDAFLLGHPDAVNETRKRIELYEIAGADGVFTPCIESESDILEIVRSTSLPLNVMCMPGLPDFDRLAALGVKRISMGNFLHDKMNAHLKNLMQEILNSRSFKPLF